MFNQEKPLNMLTLTLHSPAAAFRQPNRKRKHVAVGVVVTHIVRAADDTRPEVVGPTTSGGLVFDVIDFRLAASSCQATGKKLCAAVKRAETVGAVWCQEREAAIER